MKTFLPDNLCKYLLVGMTILLLIVILTFAFRMSEKMLNNYAPLVDAAMEIKLEATRAHLRLEEILATDRNRNLDPILQHIDQAHWYANAMLHGGENEEGVFRPLDDPGLREQLETILRELEIFRDMTLQRFAAHADESNIPEISQQYDQVFNLFFNEADQVETLLQNKISHDLQSYRVAQILLIALIALLGLSVLAFQVRFDRLRERNLKELAEAIERRENVEAELTSSEERFRKSFEEAPIGMVSCDPEGGILKVNDVFSAMMGYGVSELCSMTYREISCPEDLAAEEKLRGKLIRGETSKYQIEKRYRHKNGHLFWARVNVALIKTGDEASPFLLSHIEDINEVKKMQMTLLEHEERLHALLDATEEGIFGVDQKGDLIFINAAATRLFGIDHELTYQSEYVSLLNIDGALIGDETSIIRSVLSSGEPVHGRTGSLERIDGHSIDIEYWVRPIVVSGQVAGAVTTFLDVTEKNKMHEMQMRTSQLSVLGEVAAGVGHEINNPINGVINYAQILLNKNDDEYDTELLQRIIKEGIRIEKIVRNLLHFSQKNRDKKEEITLVSLLDGPLGLMAKQFEKDGIAIDIEIDESLPPVYGNLLQLEQVVINLLSNARHALNMKYPEPDIDKIISIFAHARFSGDEQVLQLGVFDRGCGIAAENMGKIFNPFFTTKEAGVGTGLGLSVVYEILNNHNASIYLESEPDEGTRVFVDFPIV